MAAALRRHTARALLRMQAAAAAALEVGRPGLLSQILVRGGPWRAVSSSRRFASSSGAQNINAYDAIIDAKKKEVYSLLGEMHRSKTYMLTDDIKQVLYQLSKQVGEDEWSWHRRAHFLKWCYIYGGIFLAGNLMGKLKEDKSRIKSST